MINGVPVWIALCISISLHRFSSYLAVVLCCVKYLFTLNVLGSYSFCRCSVDHSELLRYFICQVPVLSFLTRPDSEKSGQPPVIIDERNNKVWSCRQEPQQPGQCFDKFRFLCPKSCLWMLCGTWSYCCCIFILHRCDKLVYYIQFTVQGKESKSMKITEL